jgi:NitT/TauT family transport system substrate-binding protein
MPISKILLRLLLTVLATVSVMVTNVNAADAIKLALNWKPEPQFGGFYSAQLGGFFKKNGLDVDILVGGAGTPVVQMVAAGQVDFGIVSADEVVISRSHGGDVVALVAAFQTNPQGIMTHEELGYKSIADVFGSPGILAIQKGLPYAMYLMHKYDTHKVKIVPYLGGVAGFFGDKTYSQQCFITSEPLTAKKGGAKTKTFLVSDEGYNPYTTVLVTRGDVLKKTPQLVKAMVASVRAGWRDYLDHPESTNKFMGELNKSMTLETFGASAEIQKPLIETDETRKNGLGTMTEERWKALAHQLLELKLIDKAPTAKDLFLNL